MKLALPKSKNTLYPLVFVIAAIALIFSFYFYSKYQQAQNPNQVNKEEAQALLKKVGSLIVLPANETPTIATVSDKKKLTGQPFFKNAENGDKVLLYPQAQKAILYRPSVNKIIEVAPVNLNTLNTQPNQSAKAVSPTPVAVKVLILNGTTRVGLTNVAEAKLKEKMTSIQISDKDNASKKDYAKTLVSYSEDSQKAAATQIASILGGEVASLPAGEPKTSDIVIILGKDFAGAPSTPTPTEKP